MIPTIVDGLRSSDPEIQLGSMTVRSHVVAQHDSLNGQRQALPMMSGYRKCI